MVNSPDSLRPVQNPVIHINLNCYAEFPPPLQGAQRPQRGRVGVGVSDIAYELKLLFSNGFVVLTPALSLASQAMLVAARAVPVPQGLEQLAQREREHIGCFPGFQFPTQAHEKCDSPRF